MRLARLLALAALLTSPKLAAAQSHPHGALTATGCECAVCTAVPSTKKSTTVERRTEHAWKCFPKARCDLFRKLRHLPPAEPEVVPTRLRVLMKREVTKEEPTVKYEAKAFPAPCPAHHRSPCRDCHGG